MKWFVFGLVVVGVTAALCVSVLVNAVRVSARGGSDPAGLAANRQVEILLAVDDLPHNQIVSAESVQTKRVRFADAPEDYLSDPVQVVGKVLVVPMVRGQPFTRGCFAREGTGLHLASVLPQGMRAVGVSLSDFSGLHGLLYPGSMVDVVATFKPRGGGQAVSQILLEKVRVLSIEDHTIVTPDGEKEEEAGRSGTGKRNHMVTLLVDGEQAEVLQSAMQEGTISLLLRNPTDTAEFVRSTGSKLPGEKPEEAAPRVWEMEIIRERKSETKTFESVAQ